MTQEYQLCARCIMDNSADPDITFDEEGICIYCRNYDQRAKEDLYHDMAGQERLQRLLNRVREEGRRKEYDCIIGLSGGIDSSMVAYIVKKQFGLRPLAIHLDNGWDLELSVANIENIVKKLDIDLYTYVLDWEEFRDLHLSFLNASVINSEIPTDHAIISILYHTAAKKGVRYIFTGSNVVSEAIMPPNWCGYDNKDWRYIKGIYKQFGNFNLKTFPRLTLFHWWYYTFGKRIKYIPILNYMAYNRKDSLELLQKELDFRPYGAKHWESIYTRFFQTYILPKKFNIDKRRPHLSTLICSGQLSRDEALQEMLHDPCPPDMLKQDREYFIKKFRITEEEFENIMSAPIKSFKDYPNNHFWFERLYFIVKIARKIATYR